MFPMVVFPVPFGPWPECNPIVQIQVDMVDVYAEQTFDFDVLKAEVSRPWFICVLFPLYSVNRPIISAKWTIILYSQSSISEIPYFE